MFIASPTQGDLPGLRLATADAPLLSGPPFVAGLNTFPCGLKDAWGRGGKLNAHDWEFGGTATPLGGLMIRDGGAFVGEWITCVVEYRGLPWRHGGVRLDGVMFRARSGGREIGVLNCGSFLSAPVELLLASRDPSIVKVTPALGDESPEMDLFVSSVFIGSPFDMLTGLSAWWSTLKCLNGLFSSSGGMSGFFLRRPGPLRQKVK